MTYKRHQKVRIIAYKHPYHLHTGVVCKVKKGVAIGTQVLVKGRKIWFTNLELSPARKELDFNG